MCSILPALPIGKRAHLHLYPKVEAIIWGGHRCAGEWVTIEVMKVSLNFLVNQITYELPDQDLSYDMVSIPSIPHSKIQIENVKLRM